MADLLLKKKDYLSRKKDELGRFALHYAALLGYDEIMDKLLHEYPSAAYQVDNDGKTAPHLAAGNGKAKAVNKLIEMCPNCCELIDKRGRNALHLALTSADDSTIKIFLEEPALGNLINQKDKEGDTPLLQLANSGSYIRTFISHHKVDKLVFNKKNKNAADIILDKDLIMDDRVTPSNLLTIGHVPAEIENDKTTEFRRIIDPKPEVREGKVNRPSTISIKKVNYVTVKDDRNEDTNKKNDDGSEEIIKISKCAEQTESAEQTPLVAATLIATVTFAAAFTLPGGYIGEDHPNEGTAFLARSAAFQAFVIFDTLAFVLSCAFVLRYLNFVLPTYKTSRLAPITPWLACIYYAMVATILAFVTGLYAVLYPNKYIAISACVIGCYGGAFCYALSGRAFDVIPIVEMIEPQKKMKATKAGFYQD